MNKYRIPSDEEIAAELASECEQNVEANTALEFPCISCSQDQGVDGYCDDTQCPNYKGNLIAEYCARHGLEWGGTLNY